MIMCYCVKLKPCRRAGMIWQSTKDLMLFSVPIARLPSTTEHSICSSTLEELCCKRYSNLGSWEQVQVFVNPLKWWAERQISHDQASRNIPWHCSKDNQIGLLFVISNDSILHVTTSTHTYVKSCSIVSQISLFKPTFVKEMFTYKITSITELTLSLKLLQLSQSMTEKGKESHWWIKILRLK